MRTPAHEDSRVLPSPAGGDGLEPGVEPSASYRRAARLLASRRAAGPGVSTVEEAPVVPSPRDGNRTLDPVGVTGTAAREAALEPAVVRRRPRVARGLVAAGLVYLAAALLLDHGVVAHLNTRTTGWSNEDSDTFTWWLQWLPTSLGRLHNPLLPAYVHAPYGINAMWNIPVFTIGLLVMPVTLLVGPVAAYNVAMLLGPVVTGVLTAYALVPWTRTWVARVTAGGLYAFAPFLVTHFAVGHVNLVWAILPPLVLVALREMLGSTPARPWRAGIALGVGFAAQTGIYTQTIALGALVMGIALLVLAVVDRGCFRGRGAVVLRLAAGCVGTYIVICGYPIYLLLFGPYRPAGEIRPSLDIRADPLNALKPTSMTLLGGSHSTDEHLNAFTGEQGGYIGLAVLLVCVLAVVVIRSRFAVAVAAVGAVTWVFSLGPSLTTGKHDLHIWLPWSLVEHVPLLSVAEPVRLQIFIALCAAVLVGLFVDRVAGARRAWVRLGGALLAALAVVSWVPAHGAKTSDARPPAFFTMASSVLSADDVVASFPRPTGAWVDGALPVLWQAQSGMAYRITGGSFISSAPGHPILFETPENFFEGASKGLAAGLPQPSDEYLGWTQQELSRNGVTVLLVVPRPDAHMAAVQRWAERVAGRSGQLVGGVWMYRIDPAVA